MLTNATNISNSVVNIVDDITINNDANIAVNGKNKYRYSL